MDEHPHDRLVRLLGSDADRKAGLALALAAVFGGPAAVAVVEANAEGRGKPGGRDLGCQAAKAGGNSADADERAQRSRPSARAKRASR